MEKQNTRILELQEEFLESSAMEQWLLLGKSLYKLARKRIIQNTQVLIRRFPLSRLIITPQGIVIDRRRIDRFVFPDRRGMNALLYRIANLLNRKWITVNVVRHTVYIWWGDPFNDSDNSPI